MTTVEDTQEIQNSVEVTNDGAIRQEFEYVNPLVVTPITGEITTSHDKTTNDYKQESILSFYSKWRLVSNKVIDTSTDGVIDYFNANLELLWHHCSLGNPSYSRTNTGAVNFFTQRAHVGVRFDVNYKFTIYSSSQQQGALYFAYSPALFNKNGFVDSCESILYMQKGKTISVQELNVSNPTLKESYLQLPYKVVAFGGETEVLMTIPFLMKYDYADTKMIPDGFTWGQIIVGIFSPLVVRELTYDKVTLRTDVSFSNVEFVGPNFKTDQTGMGNYNYGTP